MKIKPSADPSSNKKKRPPLRGRKITADYLHNAGLYYLQRFSASRQHFESVMRRKVAKSLLAFPEQDKNRCLEMVGELSAKFEASGLLNDESYAQAMVASLRRRGRSAYFIARTLKQKGLDENIVTEKIEQHDQTLYQEDGDFFSALIHARKKKLGPFRKRDVAIEKELSKMARAGFSYILAQNILQLDKDEATRLAEHL